MGWVEVIESVGLAEEKSVKTAHPSRIRDSGLFWAILGLILHDVMGVRVSFYF